LARSQIPEGVHTLVAAPAHHVRLAFALAVFKLAVVSGRAGTVALAGVALELAESIAPVARQAAVALGGCGVVNAAEAVSGERVAVADGVLVDVAAAVALAACVGLGVEVVVAVLAGVAQVAPRAGRAGKTDHVQRV